jgi:glycosyltransferase involved in cell wall biosynthesis
MPAARTLIVVPALNERATVGHVVELLRAHGHDVLVVDDGSSDDTAVIAQRAGARVLRLPINLGVGGALRLAFRETVRLGYGVAVQCDADGQHDPGQVETLLTALHAGDLDLVIGSRFAGDTRGYRVAAHRRLAMRVLAWVASSAARTTITDPSSGFRAIGPRLLPVFARSYPADYLGDTVEALVDAGRAGFRVGEIPVTMSERRAGVASAGNGAAAWYTLRVLVIIAARWHRRGRRAP